MGCIIRGCSLGGVVDLNLDVSTRFGDDPRVGPKKEFYLHAAHAADHT